ncbi:MAG: thrombospondin type 3 repeat-containing protein, partial [Candidatus Thermoplasmatota archaeon]|nr:thrombospondin type 3 repeat-containing protein [Candidatus Thermoplasmatota archaeon]
DCWTAKLSSSGQWQWAQALRGNGDYDGVTVTTLDVVYGTSITTDSNSNPVVGGWFLGNTDVGVAADTGAQDGTDIEVFVAKYGNSGNLQWTEVARGQGSQEINTMTVDNNNDIWVATTFEVSMTFGSVVANAGINEIPMGIARISQSGTWQSAYATTGSGQPLATDFTMDDQNNLLMSGFYTGSINLGSQLTSSGQNDAFIASMNPSGSWNWAESVGGSSYDAGSGVEYDSNTGYAILGLYSQSSFNFGSQTFNTRGFNDSVVVTFTSNGNPVALFDAGSSLDDAITGISLMPNGALVVAGHYNGTIDFGSSSAASQSTSVLIPYVWVTETIAVLDADGDGVADDDDNCPNTANPGQENTDQDSEGDACDSDDDNDGITDNFPDNCPRNSQTGWTSTRDFADPASSTDWDNDGCKDDHPEDPDDDNDGVLDVNDNCPRTSYNPPRPTWVSDTTTDMDGDGCRDSDEDINDDGDAFDDSFDDCPTYYGTSTLGEQGCADSDGDGWSDESDTCPLQFGNSSANDKIGCLDSDGDGWADVDDAFDFEPTQWSDSDGDGFGDNPDGVNADDCIDVSGDSIFDRQGCYDFDEDGYSNPDGVWDEDNGADAFPQNPYQWSDFDGDGLGDNWGNSTWLDRPQTWPGEYVEFINQNEQDACPFQAGTSNQQGIYGCPDFDGDGWSDGLDVFVQEASQWLDSDGDGFGDNLDGFNGDYCPNVPGDSNQDRKGCIDTDGDGYSNIDEFWTRYSGGDVYPQDPTQWADSDGDGYGDNPGTVISDDCVEIAGDSTIDRMGCPDFD